MIGLQQQPYTAQALRRTVHPPARDPLEQTPQGSWRIRDGGMTPEQVAEAAQPMAQQQPMGQQQLLQPMQQYQPLPVAAPSFAPRGPRPPRM